jgi:myo-inositol-1-phosphate synthase
VAWLIGGRGSVAVTTVAGAAAIRARPGRPVGCVSVTEPFASLPLPGFEELVFGGHDIVESELPKRTRQLAEAGVLPSRWSKTTSSRPTRRSSRPLGRTSTP